MPDFSNPFATVDYGFDHHFFTKRTVNNVNFNTLCDVVINTKSPVTSVTFQMESGTRIEYSFNGITTHGDMIRTGGVATLSSSLVFNKPISKIWFRGDGYVRIEAYC